MNKKHVLSIVAVVALALGVNAKTYNLPKEDALATVDVPESWKVEAADESLSAVSKDDNVEFSLEVIEESQLEGAVEENLGYLKKHKVDVGEKSEKTTGEINGLTTTCYSMKGKDEDGACNISLIFVRLSDKKLISILYWAPDKVEQSQLDEINSILKSFKKK